MNNKARTRVPPKYSRAFEWRLVRGDVREDRNLRISLSGMRSLADSEYRDILDDYFEISRRRRANRAALFKLQLHLLEDLKDLEDENKLWRTKVEEINARVVAPNTASPSDREALEDAERELFIRRIYANVIRSIADGIVWRAFGYDTAALSVLSRASTKQQLTAAGTAQEIREWAAHFEDVGTALAILNSLTNCLAIGDITVVRTDGSADILEVKSSGTKSGRLLRQKHRMHEAVTLLNSGSGGVAEQPVDFRRMEGAPDHGLSVLKELLEQQIKAGLRSE